MYDNLKQKYTIRKIIDVNKPEYFFKNSDKHEEDEINNLKLFNIRKRSLENIDLRIKEKPSEDCHVKPGLNKKYSCNNLKDEMTRRQSRSILNENIVYKRKRDIYHEDIITKAILLKEFKEKMSKKLHEKNTIFSKNSLYLTSCLSNDQKSPNECYKLPLIDKIKGVITKKYSEVNDNEDLAKNIDYKKIESDKMKRLVEERLKRLEGNPIDVKISGNSFTEYSFFVNKDTKNNFNYGLNIQNNEPESLLRKAPILGTQRFFVSEISNKNSEQLLGNNISQLIEKEKKKFRINFKINIEKLHNIEDIEEAEVLSRSLSKNQLINEKQDSLKQSQSKYKLKPKPGFKEKIDQFPMKVKEKQSFLDKKDDLISKKIKIITINKTNNKEYNKQHCETAPNIDNCNFNEMHREKINIYLNKNKYYKHFNNDFTDLKSF